jgi:hypothetical protein
VIVAGDNVAESGVVGDGGVWATLGATGNGSLGSMARMVEPFTNGSSVLIAVLGGGVGCLQARRGDVATWPTGTDSGNVPHLYRPDAFPVSPCSPIFVHYCKYRVCKVYGKSMR